MVTVYTGQYGTDPIEVDPTELAFIFWTFSPLADAVLDGSRKLVHAMNEFLVSECHYRFDGDASDAFLHVFEAERPRPAAAPEPPAPKKRGRRKAKT